MAGLAPSRLLKPFAMLFRFLLTGESQINTVLKKAKLRAAALGLLGAPTSFCTTIQVTKERKLVSLYGTGQEIQSGYTLKD